MCTCLSGWICNEHNHVPTQPLNHDHVIGLLQGESICNGQHIQIDEPVNSASQEFEFASTVPTCEPDTRTQQAQGSNDRKPARAVISKNAKKLLEQHFAANPYPALIGIEMLARRTNLTIKNVQMWFSNTRARKCKSKRKCVPG